MTETPLCDTPGRHAFNAYRHTVGDTAFNGEPIPPWETLSEITRDAWEATATNAALHAERAVQGWMALDIHTALGMDVDHTDDHQGYGSWADWWAELCAAVRASTTRTALGDVVLNLDRCAHGRHFGDDCGSCGGRSRGNHRMPVGTVLGYHPRGRIVVPWPKDKDNPEAWLRRETYDPRDEPNRPTGTAVLGKCPACGHGSIKLTAGAHLLCSWPSCPNPMQLHNQLNKDTE